MKLTLLLFALTSGTVGLDAQKTDAPLNERVMVVYNSNSDSSHKVAKYYMAKRNIPKDNICKVDTNVNELEDASLYEPEVKKPIRACLEKLGRENILYIVFSFEMPYAANYGGHPASVDQLVADIWDEYAAPGVVGNQTADQPYFGKAQTQGNVYEPYVPFAKYRSQLGAKTIYSVWRLDGPTAQAAQSLVDKALYAEEHGLHGNGYFDIKSEIDGVPDNGYGAGDWDIYQASQMAKRAGFAVTLDTKETEFGTAPSQMHCDNAALYAGWYSLAHYNDAFTWAPGAIGFHLDSASATNPRSGPSWVAGALQKGITVTSGSVTEPFLEGLVHPDQIFLYLFEGANVGDAVLRGTRWLKWMILNVGDPLYTPFPKGAGPYAPSAPKPIAWFGISPNNVVGEAKIRAQFMLAEKREAAVPAVFTSNNSELIILPPTISLPPAANGAQFEITLKEPQTPVNIIVKITAGNEHLSNTINLFPILSDLSLSQPAVRSSASLTGKVSTMLAAKEDGFVIKLSSSNPNVSVPAEVKIPAGAHTVTFPISAKTVPAEISANITAQLHNATKTAQLKVTP